MVQDDVSLLRRKLQALFRRARLLRTFSSALRFLAFGLLLLIPFLLLKGQLPFPFLLGFAVLSTVVGALSGAFVPLTPLDVAKLVDQRLQLQERLSTAFECLITGKQGEVVTALLREAAAQSISPQKALPFPWKEGKMILPILTLSALLFTFPPLPFLAGKGDGLKGSESSGSDAERGEELKASPKRKNFHERKGKERGFPGGMPFRREGWEELPALFQDTKLALQRPDFGSFLKGADERLRLLAVKDALPDLSRDYTLSPYQLVLRRTREKLHNFQFGGLSGEELRRLLEEMKRLGKRGEGLEGLPFDDSGALSRPSSEKALEAFKRALQRLWEKAEKSSGEGGKGLKRDPSGEGMEEGESGGTFPGRDRSPQVKGDPTPRIEGPKLDTGLSGEIQKGKKEAYDTNLPGPAVKTPSHLPSLDLLSQYRRMMEESLSREPIPFNYREHVKRYFTSLEP